MAIDAAAAADATVAPDSAVVVDARAAEPDLALDAPPETARDGAPEAPASTDPFAALGKPERVVGNAGFLEGPLWLPQGGALLFYNGDQKRLYTLAAATPQPLLTTLYGVSALAPDGNVVVVGNKRATRMTPAGAALDVLASGFESPNDVIVRSDGTAYFTEPFAHQVVRIAPDRKVTVEAMMTKPNGVMLSADEAWLYVSDSTDRLVKRFRVKADGALEAGATFATTGSADVPDGMCRDDAGNVYVTTHPGVLVFSSAGARLGNIAIAGENPTNCSFGGADRRTLFVTTNRSLWRVAVGIAGVP